MHLLHTNTHKLKYFIQNVPRYAILSHTWEEEEVTFDDLDKPHATRMKGYQKILKSCAQAKDDGFEWIWIDTCCIDKRSSAELSEAINTMYRWYWDSEVCYAYLADVPAKSIEKSKWFTRGWTLQELLAPSVVEFFSADWKVLGTKLALIEKIEEATRIERRFLKDRNALKSASIGQKFSWAGTRETTRPEDVAYSLLGLMGINMPLLYGEGSKAFYRLQQEVLRVTRDHTIFVWEIPQHFLEEEEGAEIETSYGILAPSPDWFEVQRFSETNDSLWRGGTLALTHEMTNLGLRMTLPCVVERDRETSYYAVTDCQSIDGQWLAVPLQRQKSGVYKRAGNEPIMKLSQQDVKNAHLEELLIEAETRIEHTKYRDNWRVRVNRVRLWDDPQLLVEMSWVHVISPGEGRDFGVVVHKTATRPILSHSFDKGCTPWEDVPDITGLRLHIGTMKRLIVFAVRYHQPRLAFISSPRIRGSMRAYLEMDLGAMHHRDNLLVEDRGFTFSISARKLFGDEMPVWHLTVEIWDTEVGEPDVSSTTHRLDAPRPCVAIERDSDSLVKEQHGMKITRYGY